MSENDEPIVVLKYGQDTNCTVNLHGATITSWRVNNKEYLYLSKLALHDRQTPLAGGISLCFPKHGAWKYGPWNGFARIVRWRLAKTPEKMKNDDVEAVFTLTDTYYTRSMWTHDFQLFYKVTLGEKSLRTDVTVRNTSKHTRFKFDWLFENYLKVPKSLLCKVIDLKDFKPIDETMLRDSKEMDIDQEDIPSVIRIERRSSKDARKGNLIKNPMFNRTIHVRKKNLPDAYDWNPFTDDSNGNSWIIANEEDYDKVLCVNTGRVGITDELLPGEEFEASQVLEIDGEVFSVYEGPNDGGVIRKC